MKVTSIEESLYATIMKVDELIRSLVTFKMVIDDKLEKKSKSVAFKTDDEECDNQIKVMLMKT